MSTRTTYPGGGGYIAWNAITWLMNKPWSVKDDPKWAKRESNTVGELPPILEDLMSVASFQPMAFQGSLAAQIAALYPFTNRLQHGSMVFPSTDLPVVGQTKDGKSITYSAGQITKMPALTFCGDKPLFGDAELTMLLAAGTVAGASSSHDVVASSAYSEPSMTETDELRDTYAFTLNPGSGAVAIETDKEGIIVTPRYKPSWIKPSDKTTQQARVTEIEVDVEFTPLLMDVDTFYSTYFPMQGSKIALGKSASVSGCALNIAGSATGKANLAIANVSPVDPRGPQFDDSKSRIGKVKLKGMYVSGSPMFALTVLP